MAAAQPEIFDYVIAGAGHNSLLCAAYLAKAGNRVVVLEGRGMIGGGAKTAEVLLPGFFEDLCSSSHHVFARNPAYRDNEIEIRDFGYELFDPEIVAHYPFADGDSMTVFRGDLDQTAASIEKVSKKDAETFRQLSAARQKVAGEDPDSADPSREALFFQRLDRLSGFDAGRQLWESPQMQAAGI